MSEIESDRSNQKDFQVHFCLLSSSCTHTMTVSHLAEGVSQETLGMCLSLWPLASLILSEEYHPA